MAYAYSCRAWRSWRSWDSSTSWCRHLYMLTLQYQYQIRVKTSHRLTCAINQTPKILCRLWGFQIQLSWLRRECLESWADQHDSKSKKIQKPFRKMSMINQGALAKSFINPSSSSIPSKSKSEASNLAATSLPSGWPPAAGSARSSSQENDKRFPWTRNQQERFVVILETNTPENPEGPYGG